jgi:hypothetical protein
VVWQAVGAEVARLARAAGVPAEAGPCDVAVSQ